MSRNEAIRKNDLIYLDENRYDEPKEYFKFVDEFIREQKNLSTAVDVGCAAGEFLYFLNKRHPAVKSVGVDIMPALLEKARRVLHGGDFREGNAVVRETLPNERFDAVFSLGVLSIFDDMELVVDNLIDLCADGGRIYLFSLFNEDPMDVRVRTRRVDVPVDERQWESGLNVFSIETVGAYLKANPRTKKISFHDFRIGVDLERRGDAIRSWTFRTAEGDRLLTSGSCLIYKFKLCLVEL